MIQAIGAIDAINMSGIDRVRQRISDIETKFGVGGVVGRDFQTILDRELQKALSANVVNPVQNSATSESAAASSVEMETSNNGQSQDSANISRGSIYQRPARTVQNPALNSLPGEEALPSSINNSINPSAAIASNPTVNLEGENVETPTRTTNRESILSTEEMLEAAAAKYNVDPKLVRAVAIAESDLNQSAISSKGAIGVMQLMPETARSLGVDPYDVQQNIDGGTRYLKQLLDSFNGDVQKAIAAYNAGSGAVRRYGGIPPYAETQRYVGRVMNLLNGREQPRF